LKVNGQVVKAPTADLDLLVSTARYADTKNTAVFTLFGTLGPTKLTLEQVQKLVPKALFIPNSHRAFRSTNTAWNLLMADIMLTSPSATPLWFRSKEQAPGEPVGDPNAVRKIFKLMGQEQLDSWLIRDREPVVFDVKDGELTFTGNPYWYCFRYDIDVLGREVIIPAKKVNDDLAANFDLLRQAHPCVDRLAKLMRYSAFFRYVRDNHPAAWQNFMQQVNAVQLERYESPGLIVTK
jgi:hypothetical protein